jgi:2',3'-cyclic-nucleotide 2'-phosphodiesterase (5'-nucleotidase family)
MKNRYCPTSYLKILFLVIFAGVLSPQAQAEEKEINIIYFSNLPEVSDNSGRPGLARIAGFINNARDKNRDQFVIHGGDSLSPSALSSLDRGAHMVDILNTLEPDVFAVAKREFAYGEDVLIQRAEEALFPFVSSNTVDKSTQVPFESISVNELFSVNGVSIGIVTLTTPAVIKDYAIKRTIVLEPIESAIFQAKALKDQGADIIVLTTDFDVSSFDELFTSNLFNLIIEASFGEAFERKFGNTYHLRSPADGRTIMDMAITVTQADGVSNITNVETVRPDLKAYEPDEDVASAIALHLGPLKELLRTPIGTIEVNITTVRNSLRSAENAFANMLADSLRRKVMADATLINGGSIRGDREYEVGHQLTRHDMQAELPFRNTIALLEVTGQQIWDAIEYGIPCRLDFDGCFPQVSNLEILYSASKKALISVSIGGKALEKDKTYKLATTDYLAGGGDGYQMLASATKLEFPERGQLIREVFSRYIIDEKVISPQIENRIVIEP